MLVIIFCWYMCADVVEQSQWVLGVLDTTLQALVSLQGGIFYIFRGWGEYTKISCCGEEIGLCEILFKLGKNSSFFLR